MDLCVVALTRSGYLEGSGEDSGQRRGSGDKCDGFEVNDETRQRREARDGWWEYKKEW